MRRLKSFFKLVEDGKEDLYLGCKSFSKLSFLIQLYLVKCLNGLSNVAFNDLLELLKEAFSDAKLPKNFNEAKNIGRDLGLDYKKIDACPNDCMCIGGNMKERNSVINVKLHGGNLKKPQQRF